MDVLGQVQWLAGQAGIQKLLGVEHAAEVVQAVPAHGEHRLGGLPYQPQIVLQGVCQIQPEHLWPGGHEGVDGLVAHVEDVVHHGLLRLLKGAFLCALLDKVLDLVFGDAFLTLGGMAREQQQELGQAGSEDKPGGGEGREPLDCPGQQVGILILAIAGLGQVAPEGEGEAGGEGKEEEHGKKGDDDFEPTIRVGIVQSTHSLEVRISQN